MDSCGIPFGDDYKNGCQVSAAVRQIGVYRTASVGRGHDPAAPVGLLRTAVLRNNIRSQSCELGGAVMPAPYGGAFFQPDKQQFIVFFIRPEGTP